MSGCLQKSGMESRMAPKSPPMRPASDARSASRRSSRRAGSVRPTTAQLQTVRLHALVGATGSIGDDGESALAGDVSIRGGGRCSRGRDRGL